MVTGVPAAPEVWLRLLMTGGTTTVKGTPLLVRPFAITTTLPEVAPVGTLTVMLVALQEEAVPAVVPLNVTTLVP
jgi:hypothetical protein